MNQPLGRLLAVGNVAEVFEYGSCVVKLYKSAAGKPAAFREASIHAVVETLQLPVPMLWGVQQFGNRWGLVLDRVEQSSFAERMLNDPGAVPRHLECAVRLQMRVHTHGAPHLPELNARLAANIAGTGLLDAPRKQALLASLPTMPQGQQLCHGDFHPMNILGEIARPIVIDWGDARRGDPAADVCRSYLLLKLHAPQWAPTYLDAYCETAGMARGSVLDWLPCVAAARLAEAVPGEADRLLEIVNSTRSREEASARPDR